MQILLLLSTYNNIYYSYFEKLMKLIDRYCCSNYYLLSVIMILVYDTSKYLLYNVNKSTNLFKNRL